MSLYKIAKSLNQIKEERSHRNRRLEAAPYIAGAAAGAASVAHDVTKKTGNPRMKIKDGKLVRGAERVYHQLREKSFNGKVQALKGSALKAIPRAAAVGTGTAIASKAYKYLAEEKARREEKSRRRELRGHS